MRLARVHALTHTRAAGRYGTSGLPSPPHASYGAPLPVVLCAAQGSCAGRLRTRQGSCCACAAPRRDRRGGRACTAPHIPGSAMQRPRATRCSHRAGRQAAAQHVAARTQLQETLLLQGDGASRCIKVSTPLLSVWARARSPSTQRGTCRRGGWCAMGRHGTCLLLPVTLASQCVRVYVCVWCGCVQAGQWMVAAMAAPVPQGGTCPTQLATFGTAVFSSADGVMALWLCCDIAKGKWRCCVVTQ